MAFSVAVKIVVLLEQLQEIAQLFRVIKRGLGAQCFSDAVERERFAGSGDGIQDMQHESFILPIVKRQASAVVEEVPVVIRVGNLLAKDRVDESRINFSHSRQAGNELVNIERNVPDCLRERPSADLRFGAREIRAAEEGKCKFGRVLWRERTWCDTLHVVQRRVDIALGTERGQDMMQPNGAGEDQTYPGIVLAQGPKRIERSE